MKTSLYCFPCFYRQIQNTCLKTHLSFLHTRSVYRRLTRQLSYFDLNNPPVVFGRTIYRSVAQTSGIKDIFAKDKREIEDYLLQYIGIWSSQIKHSRDALYKACIFSCASNAIDFGAGTTPDVKNITAGLNRTCLTVDHYAVFKRLLRKTKTIMIIGDNCGEAVFDKLLIMTVTQHYPHVKVVYVVRSAPIINDVLMTDARRIGIDKVARLITSGCDYPGLILAKTSGSFKTAYGEADIIISKGQGNFESLQDKKKNIFYLFQIKCTAVSLYLNFPQKAFLFLHNKSSRYPL